MTPEQRRERDDRIAEAYVGGLSLIEVAKQIGVCEATVLNALRRKGVERRRRGRRRKLNIFVVEQPGEAG